MGMDAVGEACHPLTMLPSILRHKSCAYTRVSIAASWLLLGLLVLFVRPVGERQRSQLIWWSA